MSLKGYSISSLKYILFNLLMAIYSEDRILIFGRIPKVKPHKAL